MHEIPVTTRSRHGRWLGGVCAGLAARWAVPPARVRLGFVLASCLFGLGVLAYLAAWLILPAETEDGAGQRGIVLLAQACGALLALATLAVVGGVATVFGYGWVIVALAAAVLAGSLARWRRLGPAWALLPIGALVLPSVALAVGGVRVEPSTAARIVAPASAADIHDYRSGLGLLTVDLRHTALPASGTIPLKVDAGVRRTLIALPHDRCVHVSVNQHPAPALLRLGALLAGESGLATPIATVFGRVNGPQSTKGDGPTLAIDFTSAGGELIVRDYPDDIDPRSEPDWPGYRVYLEQRPDTTGTPRKAAKQLVREWRKRRIVQERSKARIDKLMGGPCTLKTVAK